jgi:hypothetical protein
MHGQEAWAVVVIRETQDVNYALRHHAQLQPLYQKPIDGLLQERDRHAHLVAYILLSSGPVLKACPCTPKDVMRQHGCLMMFITH